MNHMRVFISGKITGDRDYIEKFRRAANEVESLAFGERHSPVWYVTTHNRVMRFRAVNPTELRLMGLPLGYFSWLVCMAVCLWRLTWCRYVYMLGDWRESRGAQIEHRWARVMGKRIIYERGYNNNNKHKKHNKKCRQS